MNSPVLTIVSFLIIFTLVVVSHEFGHFIIARLNGIRVNEFMVGMGPVLYKKRGKQTLFTLRLLPLGGACIFDGMPGMETEEKEEQEDEVARELEGRGFMDAPVWGRIATILAGPFFNVLLGYILAIFLVWNCGADLPTVAYVSEGYPAEAAGLQVGDTVISLNGHRVYVWREVMIRSLMNDGDPIRVVYEHEGERREAVITPMWSEEAERYYIGISGGTDVLDCTNISVLKYSWYEVRYWLDATIQSLKYLLSGHLGLDALSGPVGIANVIDDTIEETSSYGGFTVFLNMVNIAVLLSVNLGVMNMLPIPALDGGRLIFLIFEAVSGRRVPPDKEGIVHMIGIVLLMILMVVVLFNDIGKFFR